MGNTESKLKFKNHINRLSNYNPNSIDNNISITDDFWNLFWTESRSLNDINNFLSLQEIRALRDSNIQAFCLLIRAVSSHLLYLTHLKTTENFSSSELLNCIRLLTKLLPFIYENPAFAELEKSIFWSLLNTIVPTSAFTLNSDDATVGTDSTPYSSSNEPNSNDSVVANVAFDKLKDNTSTKPTFNESTQNTLPLGAKLVSTAINLLFTSGFTVPSKNSVTKPNYVEFSIWEPGIGLSTKYQDPKIELDSNKLEVLKFLITLCSQCLYNPVNSVVQNGSRYLSVLVSSIPKLKILTLLASLLNTTCRTNLEANNGLDITNISAKQVRIQMATNSIQLLTLMIVYPLPKDDLNFLYKFNLIPSTTSKPINLVRYYCGKLHKDHELDLLEQGILLPFFKPFLDNSSNISGLSNLMKGRLQSNNDPPIWNVELVVLIWEFYQCNKKFREVLITKKHGIRLTIVLVYYVYTYRNQEKLRNFVRCCSYLVLFLICDKNLSPKLLQPFDELFYGTFPQSFKISTHPTTYRDFIVIQACSCLSTDCPPQLIPTFVEWIYNLVPLTENINKNSADDLNPQLFNRRLSSKSLLSSSTLTSTHLSYVASGLVMQLIIRFSSITFLRDSPINPDLLALLIRSMCHAICRSPKDAAINIYVISKARHSVEGVLRSIKNISDNIEVELDTKEEELQSLYSLDSANPSLISQQQQPYLQRQKSAVSVLSIPSGNSSPGLKSVCSNEETIEPVSLGSITEGEELDSANSKDDPNDEGTLIRPNPPVGMSEKAKGKMPEDAPLEYTWTGLQATIFLLEIINFTTSKIAFTSAADTSILINQIISLNVIEQLKDKIPEEYNPDKMKFEQLKFSWSSLSLGWYESILWGSIYLNNDIGKNKSFFNDISTSIKRVSTDWGFGSWGRMNSNPIINKEVIEEQERITEIADNSLSSTGVWTGTRIRLFKVSARDINNIKSSDLAANNLAKRLSSISFKRKSSTFSLQQSNTNNNNISQPSSPMLGSPQINQSHLFKNQNPFSNTGNNPSPSIPGSPVIGIPMSQPNDIGKDDMINIQLKLTPRSSFTLSRVSTRDTQRANSVLNTPILGPQ